jgi:hypothetical protein
MLYCIKFAKRITRVFYISDQITPGWSPVYLSLSQSTNRALLCLRTVNKNTDNNEQINQLDGSQFFSRN